MYIQLQMTYRMVALNINWNNTSTSIRLSCLSHSLSQDISRRDTSTFIRFVRLSHTFIIAYQLRKQFNISKLSVCYTCHRITSEETPQHPSVCLYATHSHRTISTEGTLQHPPFVRLSHLHVLIIPYQLREHFNIFHFSDCHTYWSYHIN